MLKKNLDKLEERGRRKPPIPYTRSTKTLQEKKISEARKNKQRERQFYEDY